MRATFALVGAGGTAAIIVLSILIAVLVLPASSRASRSAAPVVYLMDALSARERALASAVYEVRSVVLETARPDTLRIRRARSHLTAMIDHRRFGDYDKVPGDIRPELARADGDIRRLENQLLQALDLVEIDRVDAARRLVARSDSLDIAIMEDLGTEQVSRARDLVASEADLAGAARLAMWLAGLLIATGLVVPALYLYVAWRRIDRPLALLTAALDRASVGDLTTVLAVRRNDELGKLADHFNAMTGVMTDARRQDQDASRASELRYRSLFENMLAGFAYCRMLFEGDRPVDCEIVEVNRMFETLTGLKDPAGRKVSDMFPGIQATNPEMFVAYGRVATTGVPEQFELYVPGLETWFSVSAYCPEPGYFVSVFDDITEQKLAENRMIAADAKYR